MGERQALYRNWGKDRPSAGTAPDGDR